MELRARIRHFARPAAMTAALGALLVPAAAGTAPADAASKRYPVVTSVRPMNPKVGDTIVIRGRNFLRGKNKNTVVFKRDGQRAVFAKKTLATAKQIRVVVPDTLRAFLPDNTSARFRLRVLSARFSKRFTPNAASPTITALPKPVTSGSGTGTGTATGSTGGSTTSDTPAPAKICHGDEDGDMLDAALENQLGLDACNPDSDGDGVPDGYEYQSAMDLNDDEYQQVNQNLPYPGKRPYPNPLFKDSDVDYDGDGLPMDAEYKLWNAYGSRPGGMLPDASFKLLYSDGNQFSLYNRDATGRRVPAQAAATYAKSIDFMGWASAEGYNPVMIGKAAPWWNTANRVSYDIRDANQDGTVQASEANLADLNNDGWIADGERDEDADGLSNVDELRSRMTPGYWESCYKAIDEKPFPVKYAGTDLTNPDTDGDGIRDGADDQDHDDIPNLMELSRSDASGGFADWIPRNGHCSVDARLKNGPDIDGDGKPDWVVLHPDSDYGRVNPFNPCLPYTFSRTCPTTIEFGVSYAPFDNSPWYALQ